MKKTTFVVCALLFAACLLCGCGGSVTKGTRPDTPSPVSQEEIDANLRFFLGVTDTDTTGDLGNRTPTSGSELAAAKRLHVRYADRATYPHIAVTPLEDTTFPVTVNGKDKTSQNVEVRFSPANTGGKQVIVGTAYDNGYGDTETEYDGQPSLGAYTATGVATVMSLIDYCDRHAADLSARIDFDIVFVFFGCGLGSRGAEEYFSKTMKSLLRKNTLVMLEVGNLGGDRMYTYAGETKNAPDAFLRKTASAQGLRYYTLPDDLPKIDGSYLDGVPYAHFGMMGNAAAFIDGNIPSVRIFSGYYGGFNLSDLERKGKHNLANTSRDTYDALVKSRPAYRAQSVDTATLILSSLTAEGFSAAMESANSTVSGSFWSDSLWANIIVIVLIIGLSVSLIFIVKHFEKKYPFRPIVRKMKIAVFGMDYEKPTEEDVFIDVKKRERNPFDGY